MSPIRDILSGFRLVVDFGRRPVISHGLSGEVADGDADVLVAEIRPDGEGGARDEGQEDRWSGIVPVALAR